jgi:predicted Rossmann fold flavoprotein
MGVGGLANMSERIAIIGGGAAGFFAAIHAAAQASANAAAADHPAHTIILIEASTQPLGKVKISGGGRCNVTHACFDPAQLVQFYPRGGKALRGAFTRFQPQDTVRWFESRGVALKTEADGRMFPVTDDSQTIIDCLEQAAADAGVKVWSGTAISAVAKTEQGFTLTAKNGQSWDFDRLLLATGSNPTGYRWLQQLGHSLEPIAPSLFTFNIKDPRLTELPGVAVKTATLTLLDQKKLSQTGPVLITHWGLSGPATLKLSAWAARFLKDCGYRSTLQINWLPEVSSDQLRATLLAVKDQMPQKSIHRNCPVLIPQRLWQSLLDYCEIAADSLWAGLSHKKLDRLLQELQRGQFPITGKGVFKEEFVTCGGVRLGEVDFKTMASKICPGLYFAGEILDIDGVTGGFNFQNAWTTGWLAGKSISAPER